jgi:hypothetical protein
MEENAVHILLKCSETKQWREKILNSKCTGLNEALAYKKIINCTKAEEKEILKMTVFWDVAPCRLREVYTRFRGTCCLHHQG